LAIGGNAAGILVSVNGGKVVIEGSADSWVISRLAAQSAMTITGVSEIDNQINVKSKLERSNDNIRNDVRHRLSADVYIGQVSTLRSAAVG
jgi:osmotically-inducible protein OsmY